MLSFQKKSILTNLLTAFILVINHHTIMGSTYEVTPLISNLSGKAAQIDPNLRNSWGLFFVPNGEFWVADNSADVSTLYHPDGRIENF